MQNYALIKCPHTYLLLVLEKNKKKNLHKSPTLLFVGVTIAFSICNKPFKPLGSPSGRVRSREGL